MKRTDIKRRPLADTTLSSLEPEAGAYRELDSPGLYFRVKPNGQKSWELRYKKPDGKWSWLGLGGYPEVGGAFARQKAADLRSDASEGKNPITSKKARQAAEIDAANDTFEALAREWHTSRLMEVRMLAVPADASKGLGMFDALNGFEDAAALSDALKARVAKYYGTPLTAFLHALCAPGEMLRWAVIVRRTVEQFITQNLPASASGQAQRAALRFGLAAAAGELATAFGVTGWPDGTATTAARVCLHAWLAERGGAGNFEGDAILARLRQVIERFGESRFTRWESAAAKIDEHGPRTIDRLGFRKTLEHGMGDALHTTNTYYVLPEAWRAEIFKGMNISAVNKELLQRGVLEPGSDGKAYSLIRLPGLGPQRCYVVKTVPGTDEGEAKAA
ncbi:integrase arm-type DNA-binding domain-containing protein [Pseudomonas fildesensis]|uniref:integrase arm-type DNA-binding domain-containing protein n=1 Tax=Pseudomonas fildesensis TaxID=1674920 RepID=UPI00387B64B4